MVKLILLSCVLLITSCATTAGYKKICNSYIGSDETNLVMNWGQPSYVGYINGGKVMIFRRESSYVTPTQTNISTNEYGNVSYDPYNIYYNGKTKTQATC